MKKGMYLNAKDLNFISNILWGDICWSKLSLRVCEDEKNINKYVRDLENLTNLYCKINRISKDYFKQVCDYIELFRQYTHVKSNGLSPRYEEIELIDKSSIFTKGYLDCNGGSAIGWGVCERSVFVDDTFYPYGIDRKDVFMKFKKM